MEPLEEISKSKLIKYKVKFSEREDRAKTFRKVTDTTSDQKKYFKMVDGRNQEPNEPRKLCVVRKEKSDFLTFQEVWFPNCLIGDRSCCNPQSSLSAIVQNAIAP